MKLTDRYLKLEEQLFRARALSLLTEELEDRLLDAMDLLWTQMPPEERRAVDRSERDDTAFDAPISLSLEDTDLSIGSDAPLRRHAG